MDTARLTRKAECEWWIEPEGKMRVPAVIYATEALVRDMDEKVREQITNVATLPGIVRAAYCMPDAHWGYGFPIGGVAAFDAEAEGIVSAGGMAGAAPEEVSEQAMKRQQDEMGTLGSGNHYLEVQSVAEVYDEAAARSFHLQPDDAVVSIHCGSRGLGHQIGSEYLKQMVVTAAGYG